MLNINIKLIKVDTMYAFFTFMNSPEPHIKFNSYNLLDCLLLS